MGSWNLRLQKIKNQGYLNEKQIQFYLDNHFSGKKDFSKKLWNIIIFKSGFQNIINEKYFCK